ncbi:hypothetical protein T4B_8206 [Trichinella pseudospiralis]|uniref:Uncharacterized protein n=2 Tax=Trichinella pseudospiralis TaxID=6337 RepID=A0A0V1IUL3_TRIPS|nr:hypothetical protein T4D_15699 [Trichinella pseudospiralis]KRZ10737.1 hypothetical protein T4B_8206 [Trichinella pseudospiralis]KRZ26376.1 hypothetical protein T4C_6236 [Trichinella pseudospiralis]
MRIGGTVPAAGENNLLEMSGCSAKDQLARRSSESLFVLAVWWQNASCDAA